MENIDVSAAQSVGIRCLHAPEGNRDAVAEHALGMLLSLLNHLPRADREVRQGRWQREANRGTELSGKTIGIIGYGNMGSAFAQRLSGFGVRVLVHDTDLKTEFPPDDYRASSSLARIQEEAHVVSLHINYTQENHHYVNPTWLNAFEKPIYLINTARGKVLDTRALLKSIQEGKVLGACLDVLEFESLSFETLDPSAAQVLKQLMEEERVLLTPHIAGWSHESNEKMARTLAEKIGHPTT
jgi:D-3-phosphoglycerate dehydrogenase